MKINLFGKKQVKLDFATCGEVFIDGLTFSFGVESAGARSDKGLCISISGEAIDNGSVTFSNLEYHEKLSGGITVVKHDFPKITKKDGKQIYQARFQKIPIPEAGNYSFFHKTTEDEVLSRINSEINFKVTPHYTGNEMPELMLTVYPYENPLTGSAVQWIKCTADQDYFLHKFKKQEK